MHVAGGVGDGVGSRVAGRVDERVVGNRMLIGVGKVAGHARVSRLGH